MNSLANMPLGGFGKLTPMLQSLQYPTRKYSLPQSQNVENSFAHQTTFGPELPHRIRPRLPQTRNPLPYLPSNRLLTNFWS
jgi:hypothetical protein